MERAILHGREKIHDKRGRRIEHSEEVFLPVRHEASGERTDRPLRTQEHNILIEPRTKVTCKFRAEFVQRGAFYG